MPMSKGFVGVNGNRIRANEYNSLHINTWEASRVVRKLVVVVDGCSLMAYHLSEADLIEMHPARAIQGRPAFWWVNTWRREP